MDRVYAIPTDATHFYCFSHDSGMKQHPSYLSGKAGDPEAALQVIQDTAFDFLASLRGRFPEGTIFVSPYAKEAAGDNALPLVLSLMCAQILSGESDTDIVQQQRVFHTGADPMERLRLRPTFEGGVKPDANYVLVDDVTSMGVTLAELANYLMLCGGRVLGTIVLVNAGRSKEFRPVKKHIKLLEERFGDEIRHIFGIHTCALTANEAGYLVGFRTVNEIRNRRAKAAKETDIRLLSKGY